MKDKATIELEPITLYKVMEITGDSGEREVIGYKHTKAAAELLSKGKGYYSGDGEYVKTILHTDGTCIYSLELLQDLPKEDAEKEDVLKSIKSKLSESELKAIGL